VWPKLITASFVAVALQQRPGSAPTGLPSGPGAMPSMGAAQTPTAFEQFVSKLKLDQKKQLPQVQQILMSTAVDTEPVVREMTGLRRQMLDRARASEDLAPLITSYTVEAAKLTGLEVRAFNEIRSLLRTDQLPRSTEAFAIMAGIFHPPTSSGMRSRGRGGLAMDVASFQQRGGGGGTGGGGQRGTGGGGRGVAMSPNREDVLTAVLFLNNDQKKQFKTIMDAAYKSSAQLRDELAKTRGVIGGLIDQDAPTESLSQAVDGYAAPVAQMTAAEVKALAQVLALLSPEQQPNAGTIQTSVSLMRGAFVSKKWNTRVDSTFY
jgi:hypothetical protein